MRIGLDCRLSGPTHAGIGRYIENLLLRLPTLAPDVQWVYIFSSKKQYTDILDRADSHSATKLKQVECVFSPIQHYTLKEQLAFPRLLNSLQLDLLHVPHFNIPLFYKGRIVVTIHDLLWHEYKGTHVTTLTPWMYWLKYWAYRFVASQAVAKAETIFVPADTIKKTLKKYYPHAEKKIVVTKEGVDDRLTKYKDSSIVREKNKLLYVGSLYPHKNIAVVIDALQHLPEWKLTIIGSRSVFQERVRAHAQKMGVLERVEFTGYLDDQALAHHLQIATALVQPSFSEGFGLTGVEALALGTPVIASNIPIFREIYQNAAVYFDPAKPKSFIRFLKYVKTSGEWNRKAQRIVAHYSWDEMAAKTVAYVTKNRTDLRSS